MGLPSTPYFLCLHYFRLVVAHSHFSTSHTAHGFATSLSPGSFRPICLFYGPVIHYSCCLGLMVFLSTYELFSAHVAGLLLSTGLPKISINKVHYQDLLYCKIEHHCYLAIVSFHYLLTLFGEFLAHL